jgi:Uma2 family endonuclease
MNAISPDPARSPMTPQEYLAIERRAEGRHEYARGVMYALVGLNYAHSLITTDVLACLHGQLKGRPFEALGGGMRLHVPATGLFTYADVVVAHASEAEFLDAETDTLLNPVVIVEVLSPQTEDYDRGRKFSQYRTLPSLREYVLVPQDRMAVDWYRREGDHWTLREATGPQGVVVLESIGCVLPLATVYERAATSPEVGREPLAFPGPPPA